MARVKDSEAALGNCAENALRSLLSDPTGLIGSLAAMLNSIPLLCHGYPTLTKGVHAGKVGFHAWIEIGPTVVDCGSGSIPELRVIPTSVYYRVGKIKAQYVMSYTARQAAKQAIRWNHVGPWHDNEDPDCADI